MYELENPSYFFYLAIIPAILLLFWIYVYWRKKARKKLAQADLLPALIPEFSKRKSIFKLILMLFVLSFIIVALVNPRIGSKLETVKRKGIDLVFALDVSKSMLCEDIRPNRLKKAKHIISKIIDKLSGDRIGIVVYAGKAYPQLPITTDYTAAKMFLENTNTDIVPTQGTAIGDAIDMAKSYFESRKKNNQAIIIISDGENHQEGALEAAKEISKEGIKIYSIGIGTPEGGPIPIERNGFRTGFKKDQNGNVVVTKLDRKILQKIAITGNGEYINGINTNQVVGIVKKSIEELEKQEFEAKIFSDYEDWFQFPLALAFIFVFMEFFIPEKKSKWIRQIF